MSDREFKKISERCTLLCLFGKIGLNNAGREEARSARKVGCGFPIERHKGSVAILSLASKSIRVEVIFKESLETT